MRISVGNWADAEDDVSLLSEFDGIAENMIKTRANAFSAHTLSGKRESGS
jgi:hypothetical protein